MASTTENNDDSLPKDRHFVTALARGLDILRCFTQDRPELSPSDIVRMTGLPQPTVWRLCHTLHVAGYLICPGDGSKMALGVPAMTLGLAALARQTLAQVALPYMQSMTARHKAGMSLAVRSGLEMVYVQRTRGEFTYFNDAVGARRPLATAPTGWACLAALPPGERTEILAAVKRQQGNDWKKTERNISEAVAQYREQGFILSLGVLHDQLNGIAVPIIPDNSGVVHGLSLAGLASIWTREKLLGVAPEMIDLARQLSALATSATTMEKEH